MTICPRCEQSVDGVHTCRLKAVSTKVENVDTDQNSVDAVNVASSSHTNEAGGTPNG